MRALTLTKQRKSSLALILYFFPRIASPRWFCILISRLSQYSLGNRQRRCSLYILYKSAVSVSHRRHRRCGAFGRSRSVATTSSHSGRTSIGSCRILRVGRAPILLTHPLWTSWGDGWFCFFDFLFGKNGWKPYWSRNYARYDFNVCVLLRQWCLQLASIRCLANPDLFKPKFDFCAIFVFGLLRYWGLKFWVLHYFCFVSALLRLLPPSLLSISGFCPVLVLDQRFCTHRGRGRKGTLTVTRR